MDGWDLRYSVRYSIPVVEINKLGHLREQYLRIQVLIMCTVLIYSYIYQLQFSFVTVK